MADFYVFLPHLLRFEGGFVNDPADPGGATNKGVTLSTFKGCAQNILKIAPTLENLKALTDEQAGKIYKILYWDKMKGDEIELQDLANIVCDFYVNSGMNATKLLQKTLNAMGATPSLTPDGIIGLATTKALRNLDQEEVYRRYKQGRVAYYQQLVKNQPGLGKFLKGWLNRVHAFPEI